MKEVYCIGEILVDLIGVPGLGMLDSPQFAKLAGGAPANVAVAIAKLGGRANFMGQVGIDGLGDFLLKTLHQFGVETRLCHRSGKTTLALVAIDATGEREFEFYRGSDGDYNLSISECAKIDAQCLIHFGSATAWLNGELSTSYTRLLRYAKAQGNFISFDPNYRQNLISNANLPHFRKQCEEFIRAANLIKLSEEEALLLSQQGELSAAVSYLRGLTQETVIITCGARGALLSTSSGDKLIPSPKIQQIDSTGAGDAFVGALLFRIAKSSTREWEAEVSFANQIGGLTCTKYGAIEALPTMTEFMISQVSN